MIKIEPYLLRRSEANGFNFYYYLHIRGGSGNPLSQNRNGGEYNFLLYYAAPSEMEDLGDMCEMKYCEENKIPFGLGNTIEEAYLNYRSKVVGKVEQPIT